MKKIIKNQVLETETINWTKLKDYEANTLKTDRDIEKIVNSIKTKGFIAPIFIYEEAKYIIDGAGRKMALIELEKQGYDIDDLPIVSIVAKDLKEAKELVLLISSNHGNVDQQSYKDFMVDFTPVELLEIVKISSFDFTPVKVIEPDIKDNVVRDDLSFTIKFETLEQKNETVQKLINLKEDGGFITIGQTLYKYFS
jgi:ParB-like nuclease domain